MTPPFVYNDRMVEKCSSEYEQGAKIYVRGAACRILFRQFCQHYKRDAMDHQAAAERFENFVENVHLVHYHNRRSDVLHRIALNQFSDRHPNEMPLYPINSDRDSLQDVLPKDVLVNLSSRNGITSALLELETRRRLHHGDKKKKHHKGHHKKVKMDIDPQDRWAALESASGAGTMEGRQVRIKARESDIDQILDVGDDDAGESLVDDNFEKYLNWATRDNPDGVSIVHPASDQGACGSCWAFAATGTLEASLSRRFAFETYTNQVIALENSTESEIEQVARDAELEAITLANLSVQELVDCDTSADQGCVGGNPLLAFFFIHRYGLTSAKNYPYVGEQQLCRVRKVAEPIATSKSWGILTSNHEDNMELVLRWIGPVAVGVDGSDPTFLAYKSGIYDSQTCGQDANHALLIVGYGEEEQEDGSLQRFWIARNSWGESWGENGYVKVKRGNGQLDLPGVCGIAKNPSVALGGVLLPNSGIKNTSIRGQGVEADRTTERLEESLLSNYCDALGLGDLHTCHTVQGFLRAYPAVTFGSLSVIAVVVFVVWPLTRGCRERRRRRELRRRLVLLDTDHQNKERTESQSLLHHSEDENSSKAHTYGSSGEAA